jgi:hypothetical protein
MAAERTPPLTLFLALALPLFSARCLRAVAADFSRRAIARALLTPITDTCQYHFFFDYLLLIFVISRHIGHATPLMLPPIDFITPAAIFITLTLLIADTRQPLPPLPFRDASFHAMMAIISH